MSFITLRMKVLGMLNQIFYMSVRMVLMLILLGHPTSLIEHGMTKGVSITLVETNQVDSSESEEEGNDPSSLLDTMSQGVIPPASQKRKRVTLPYRVLLKRLSSNACPLILMMDVQVLRTVKEIL